MPAYRKVVGNMKTTKRIDELHIKDPKSGVMVTDKWGYTCPECRAYCENQADKVMLENIGMCTRCDHLRSDNDQVYPEDDYRKD
jgi:hypothetical protein